MSIALHINEIRAEIDSACARTQRDPSTVHLLAVSKHQPVSLLEEAYFAGLRDFGENYVQELLEKKAALAHLPGIRWHLIGHLQTNKARLASGAADYFHALDSEKLARELAKRAVKPLSVFIQVKIDDERTKSGMSEHEVGSLIELVRKEPMLRLEGLMCIPEPRSPIELMRPAFRRLASLASGFEADAALKLSMGMSSDFTIAIEEGANWIRVGTRLFGER